MRSLRLFIPLFGIAAFSYLLERKGTDEESITSSEVPEYIVELYDRDWVAPDTVLIPYDENGELIRYGRQLIVSTGTYFGPKGKISKKANGMNCQNCHLDAGTKLHANSFSAVYANYPKLRPRSGIVEDLEKRINDCMERSMNGDKIPSDSREMQAMQAYINWVGKDVKKNVVPKGASVVKVPYLSRPADPENGMHAFQTHCITCHGLDGQGKLNEDGAGYIYPPLWGNYSYNTAAGMYRLSRLAGFIKSNMPYLIARADSTVLTDEEAWDIAAYINSQPRTVKHFKDDWPDISKKPIDHPFGPFDDGFSETQHKYGPFGEIEKKRKDLTTELITNKN